MTLRRDLIALLTIRPRSVSSLARDLGIGRRDMEEELGHSIRSARAAGHGVIVDPARCRVCGFAFSEEKLSKPGKCPSVPEYPTVRGADPNRTFRGVALLNLRPAAINLP